MQPKSALVKTKSNFVIRTPNHSCQSDWAEWFGRLCTLYLDVTPLVTTCGVDYFILFDSMLTVDDGLYHRDQFHTAHGIPHLVNEGCRCAGNPVNQADVAIFQYLFGIMVARHFIIKFLKVKPNLFRVLT